MEYKSPAKDIDMQWLKVIQRLSLMQFQNWNMELKNIVGMQKVCRKATKQLREANLQAVLELSACARNKTTDTSVSRLLQGTRLLSLGLFNICCEAIMREYMKCMAFVLLEKTMFIVL